MQQLEIDFTDRSPINTAKLTGQNKLVYEHLLSGKTINCFEAQDMYITALNSRISTLRNDVGIKIYSRRIKTRGGSSICEYSLTPFFKP